MKSPKILPWSSLARLSQFTFFCNLPQYVKEPYKRFLENKIREKYDFTGTTIDIFMRKK